MKEMTGQSKLALVAVGAVILGAFLPWWTILGFGISGVDQGDGAITLILAAIAGGLIAFARDRKVAPVMGVLCGLGITGVALYHVIDTAQTKVFGASMIGIIGAGLWITLVAGIVLTGAAGYGLHGVTRIDQPRSET